MKLLEAKSDISNKEIHRRRKLQNLILFCYAYQNRNIGERCKVWRSD